MKNNNPVKKIGDNTLAESESNILVSRTSCEDELEYRCWDLFKSYAIAFDMKLTNTSNNSDDIDFAIAKTVQDKMYSVFEEMGYKIVPDKTEF